MDRIIELAHKKLIYNTEYHEIDRYFTEILFLGERETCLSGENIPGGLLMHGTTRASLHKHSRLTPKQCNQVEATPADAGKVS